MGKSSSKSTNTSNVNLPAAQTAAMNAQAGASIPLLQQLSQMFMQALSSGNVNEMTPLMQRGVEASKNTTANRNRQTDESIAKGGITGPFATQLKAGTAQQGAFDTSQISPQMIQALLQYMPDFGMMRGSGVFGGTSSKGATSSGSENKSTVNLSDLFNFGTKLSGLFGPSTAAASVGGGVNLLNTITEL